MATKEYKCKVCGYVHKGTNAPEKCPLCGSPSSEFEEIKKGLNTSSNTYTIFYSVILVIVVAFLLAFVSKTLQPQSDKNVMIDKKSQILSSLNIRNVDKNKIEAIYEKVIVADKIVNAQGLVIKDGENKDQDGFKVNTKEITDQNLPLYVCNLDGQTKYVIPVTGRGLWGGLWGYIALNADKKTIYGAYFSHESETAGLGARITEYEGFQKQFEKKQIFDETGKIGIRVLKDGKSPEVKEENRCDAITGATLTSDGVNNMLHDCLTQYIQFFKQNN